MNLNLCCLLVSPQPGDRLLVEEALSQGSRHLQIKQATDVHSWQQALEAGDFDLSIIAETLPWAETSAVVRDLKSRHPECPVIMLADPEREEAAWETLRRGVDDYVLTSPEEMRRLPTVVRAARYRVRRLADITARQEAEKALRKSEVLYRLLVETMNDGLGMQDENGVLSLVNQRFCEMLGYSREELLKRPPSDFLDAANQEILQEQMKRRQKGERQTYELTWTRKDGTKVITSISPVPMFDATGKFQGSFGVVADITARRQAEQALRESEEKYRTIFENTGTATAILEEDTTISLVNAEYTKLSGYSREELEGKKSWTEFHSGEDLARMREYHRLRRLDPQMAPRNYEALFIDRHGEVKDILLTVAVIPGTRKSVASLLDITARKKAEQELEYERKKLQVLAEHSPFAMVLIGKEGKFKYINPKFIELFGYGLEEVADGKTWFQKAYPDPAYRHQVISAWAGDLERSKPGEKRPRTFTVTCKDGSEKVISFIPLQLDNGDNLMTCEDITERHLAVEAVKQSEQRFRLLIENSMYHLRIIEPDGTIRYESPTLERMLGYDIGEMLGKNSSEFLHPEDQARSQEIMRKLLESPGMVVSTEVRYRHKDGSWRWLEVKAKNLLDEPLIRGIVVNAHDITKRIEALEALRESEELHSRILDTMPDLVYELSLDGDLIYANRVTSEILGYTPDELRRISIGDLVDEAGLQHAKGVIQEMVASRQPSSTESYHLRTAQGHFIPIETRAILVERSNQPPTIVGVARDITQRQQAEQALRQSEAEKSLILRNMSEKVIYYDRDNRILWANQAMADFAGLTSEELVGRFCYEILHQRHTPCTDCPVIKAMEAGQPLEIEMAKPDGRILFYRSSPVKDENGEIQGSVLMVRDITARKKAEEGLKASEEKMRLVIETSPVGIRITQQDRHIYANLALVKMFGYDSADDIVGQPGNIIFDPADCDLLREKKEAALAGKLGPASFEAKGLKKDGTRLDVQVWQTEIDYHGEPAILDFVLDISEAKALRSQLLQAQKMDAIGTLAGGIAHDFNNLLFPMLVNVEMILENLAPDTLLRRRMERVFKACERAIDLVKQILSFSRQEERELSLVRLTPVIDDSLRLLRASLPATIEMRRHLESDADTVLADPTQIQQVLINLYTNAAHALRDRGGVIDISLREVDGDKARGGLPPNLGPGPHLQLTVKDNGHGMDAATKERILDPYFTTKKPGEGTGLGLAIVHGIIKKYGGAISVESELGKGSSFHIFLPRVEGEALKETRDLIPPPQGRERILLVDDEAEIVATLQQMLESLGYRVAALTGGAAALDTFRAQPEDFDLVITDQTMPHLTGEELAREMLRLRPDLPIILCTGFSEAVSPEKARAMGIREFIIKPITARAMAETIRRALGPHHDLS